jgi:MFS family permease
MKLAIGFDTMSEEIPLTDMGGPKEPEQGVVPGPEPREHLDDLMYRRFGCFPYYASPVVQLLMVASICCLLPGGYNALTGVGAAGQSTPTVFDNSTTALYAAFAFASFFSGSVVNRIGIRYSLALGGLGYNLYAGSLLHYNNHPSENSGDFMIAAGVVLGFSAGLLWAAQGTILVSYPPEHQKGRCIALFWCLFNIGAVLATLVSLSIPSSSN